MTDRKPQWIVSRQDENVEGGEKVSGSVCIFISIVVSVREARVLDGLHGRLVV
jgi:hypothetical protein